MESWRVRVAFADERQREAVAARLEVRQLQPSGDEVTIVLYAESEFRAGSLRDVVRAECAVLVVEPAVEAIDEWIGEESRWSNDPPEETAPEEGNGAGDFVPSLMDELFRW